MHYGRMCSCDWMVQLPVLSIRQAGREGTLFFAAPRRTLEKGERPRMSHGLALVHGLSPAFAEDAAKRQQWESCSVIWRLIPGRSTLSPARSRHF